ncbi:uncharacterized protein LOC105249217 isoform X1 [Camponotus floridanus]|uniref:uncharacterized protein LOC105249217 isoform X1 n=1 Tax=Camponotus floridanus TaxID=104421 RepID=UPI000DC6A7D3|nr:uncharacterized protein LOC105249217 isoform X1 [Camponotus floridanus]XP_025262520.1 uncharacterized protein LOC105249217 isoform X1 [Camponotus floridanus]
MEIQTFIFFDLKTTGLIQEKLMPRITEIALIAVGRESICNSNKASLPRVLQKLILPINPQKIIPPNVEYITKLFNDDMLLLRPFECEVYELIMCFLQRLTPPICFAAHNGKSFYYPIFFQELERTNKVLDDKILCIDTWNMFKDLFEKKDSEPKMIQNLLNDEYNNSLSMLDMDIRIIGQEATATSTSLMTSAHDGYIKTISNKKYDINEVYNGNIDIESSKNFRQKDNEKTPENQIIRQHEIAVKRPFKNYYPRKRLDFGCEERPVNLQLNTIYKCMFGSNIPQEHSAEAGCLAMIRCVTNIVDFFLEWSDNHAIPFASCKGI